MGKFWQDFKKFITRGNVMDLAVAVIIGAAFSAIVTSLVQDIIMPLLVWIFAEQDLSSLVVILRPETVAGAGDALTWNYGAFLQSIINFFMQAMIVFLMLKAVMGAKDMLTPKYGVMIDGKEYKALKKQGKTKEEIAAIDKERVEAKKVEDEAKKAEEEANSTEGLLKQIRDLLKENNELRQTLKRD